MGSSRSLLPLLSVSLFFFFFIFVLFCALQHQVASTTLHNGLQTLPPDQGNATQYPLNGSHFQLLLPRRAFGAAERGRPGTLSVQNNFEQSEQHSSLHLTLEWTHTHTHSIQSVASYTIFFFFFRRHTPNPIRYHHPFLVLVPCPLNL